jgi:hypothetical protein
VLLNVPLSRSSTVAAPSCTPTHGSSRDPTTITACCAMATLVAAARRSRLFAIASATIASSTGSSNDFTQSFVTSPPRESARQAGGIRVSFGNASSTTSGWAGEVFSAQPASAAAATRTTAGLNRRRDR